jgi:hypothetical protein
MAWKMIEKPKTIVATKSIADEFVQMEPAPYDRPLSERRLQVYERILKQGAFRPVVWASATCYETNATYRVNGKHTSILLSRQNPFPTFYVTIERWGCDNLQDVGSLYNTYDSNLSSRTNKDINLSFAATMPELRDIPVRLINLTVSAASSLKWDENAIRKVPQAERAEELLDRVDFVKWLQEVVETTSMGRQSLSKHLLRTAVVSAMMATYDRAPLIAKQFWAAVRDESAADRNDPTRVLARFLVRAVMIGGGRSQKSVKEAVGHREMYVKCIHAWNAFRAGETTSLAYHAKADLPKISK